MSHLEEHFAMQLEGTGVPEPQRQVLLHSTRRWRFDFAWPALKLAVEIEGGSGFRPLKNAVTGRTIIGHHQHAKGYLSDCRKYNLAVVMGWRLLRFTGAQVKSGEALMWTEFVLAGKTIDDRKQDTKGARAARPDRRARAKGREAEGAPAVEDGLGAAPAAHGASGVHGVRARRLRGEDPRQDPQSRAAVGARGAGEEQAQADGPDGR